MKVVHISTNASGGGAAIAALRIHQRLLDRGFDSVLLVMNQPATILERVEVVQLRARDKARWRLDALKRASLGGPLHVHRRDGFSFNMHGYHPVHLNPHVSNADIVCLYWVGHGFVSPQMLRRFRQPLVWRLSDMWPFTGGCHYSSGCDRYAVECGACPQLKSNLDLDPTRALHSLKKRAWQDIGISVVSPSTWIQDKARRSSLFRTKEHYLIATGVDQHVFRPRDRNLVRASLGVEARHVMVLFGAINADPRKGIEHLERLVHRTADRGYRYFVFGPPPREGGFQCPGVTFLGTVSDEVSLSELYSAADVFLAPSLEDNLPNTVLESMACGTPVVSFKDSGGVVDVIEHLDSGYLADRSQPDGLEQGVTWTLDANRTRMLSEKVRGRIVPRFTLDRQVDQYVELYRALLQRGAPGDSMGQGYSEST